MRLMQTDGKMRRETKRGGTEAKGSLSWGVEEKSEQNKTNEPAQMHLAEVGRRWRGGFNSCVISPFKFHKQLNILCAFCAFLLSRGETMEITRVEREREREAE